jgi:hypothetical protein
MKNLKNICKLRKYSGLTVTAALIGSIVVLMYCGAATEKEKVEEIPAGEIYRAEQEYDPLGDPRDRRILESVEIEPQEIPASDDDFNWAKVDSFLQAQEKIDSSLTIYRIQLFASQYYTEARYEQQIAQEVFSDTVFIKYDLPYYKVLLGNAESEREGRRLLYNARSLGYYNSWLIESPPDSIYYRMLYIEDSIATQDSLMKARELEETGSEPEIE